MSRPKACVSAAFPQHYLLNVLIFDGHPSLSVPMDPKELENEVKALHNVLHNKFSSQNTIYNILHYMLYIYLFITYYER